MIETKGFFLQGTLNSLGLEGDEKSKTIRNAKDIIEKVVHSYETEVGSGHVGKGATGVPNRFLKTTPGPIGLVYGRIQSGKTRAMIVSTAMSFDNGFKIVVVLTSNINDLVNQTHLDFVKELKGVSVYTKDDELDQVIPEATLDIQNKDGRILVVASKGPKSLRNIVDFLKTIGARSHPVLIFDDEGDQASLDTNTYKRSATGNLTLEPSSINKLIRKLRIGCPASVYVSVTGTPQAVLLQSASSDNRPSFVQMLPHGEGYVGGDFFFNAEEPENNSQDLIAVIPGNDQAQLLNNRSPIPQGLKSSIVFFLLSAGSASKNLGWPSKPSQKDKGYQFLCHPSLKNNEQGKASQRIQNFLTQIKAVLLGHRDEHGIEREFQTQYAQLKKQLGVHKTPSMDELKKIIQQELLRKKILVINAQNTRRQGIEYGPGLNFLVGGNTLGRGIAIPNLLVTYYVRSARMTQIDTMHQHARMFGYRESTLPYTRLFTTKTLYYRFRDIHFSDTGLRAFISKYSGTNPSSFPVEYSEGLRATRRGVLDVNTTDIVWPGMQIYPNYIKLPQPSAKYRAILKFIGQKVGLNAANEQQIQNKIRNGVTISTDEAIWLVSSIKTSSKNSWHDKTIGSVIAKLADRLGENVRLRFRIAQRTVEEGGFLSSGTLSGPEQTESRGNPIPTLWIMSVTGKAGSQSGENETFMYPTIVVPTELPQVFVFSKK